MTHEYAPDRDVCVHCGVPAWAVVDGYVGPECASRSAQPECACCSNDAACENCRCDSCCCIQETY